VTLLLILVLVTLVLFGLFWGGSLIAQGYLYNQPADQLPLRAAAAALLVGSFLTVWCWIDRRNPGKYDTFFEFAPYSTKEFPEFEAIRWTAVAGQFKKDEQGNLIETPPTKFKRAPGGKTAVFVEEGSGQPFKLNDSRMMTAALLVKVDEAGEPVRFNAVLKERTSVPQYTDERRFNEVNGSRYIMADETRLGTVFVPSTGVVAAALLLNLAHFAVWFVACWLILRFGWGHALGFATVFGLVTMLLVMPLLFKPNRTPRTPAPAPVAAAVEEPGPRTAGAA
jgi:hypothetical protein